MGEKEKRVSRRVAERGNHRGGKRRGGGEEKEDGSKRRRRRGAMRCPASSSFFLKATRTDRAAAHQQKGVDASAEALGRVLCTAVASCRGGLSGGEALTGSGTMGRGLFTCFLLSCCFRHLMVILVVCERYNTVLRYDEDGHSRVDAGVASPVLLSRRTSTYLSHEKLH